MSKAPKVNKTIKAELDDSLVLNAWMFAQFGFKAMPTDDSKPLRAFAHSIERTPEGLGEDGLHRFYHQFKDALPANSSVKSDSLLRYEENIVAHTARLNAGRSRKIAWKYFQWLTLLCVERYLDRFFQDRQGLLDELNAFVPKFNDWRSSKNYVGTLQAFSLQELNKVCLQNATGSGKTLLMHANLLQFRHHAKAANQLADYSRALLLTPGEDLTTQHLRELDESGIRAQRFIADLLSTSSADLATVDALEIHKLAEKDGEKTIALRNFGDANLLLVDEGHVGLGSDDETGFMARRDALSNKGFVFEYSATFAQAVKAAKNEAVTQAYAKSVLFDYSYRYFYEDGYGKDYQVFNLADDGLAGVQISRIYLTASLLSFYQQLRVFDEQQVALAAFNLEKPLWVFVGASVVKATGGKKEDAETATDVVNIVQFIANFLHDWQQSEADIQQVFAGAVKDSQHIDLFEHSFSYLKEKLHAGETLQTLHQDVLTRLFGGGSLLRLTRVSGETAEIRLHTGDASKPFGLINVGDAPGLMKELEKCVQVQVEESQFSSGALFGEISQSASTVNVLIGSRKFIAGWDCWRVSTLGLMNIGKSEGSQIIQLFGRGVRLKGKDWSLKRSNKLAHCSPPKHIRVVETLGVFGVKANYMQQFQQMLSEAGLPGNQRRAEKIIPMNVVHDFGKKLMVLAPKTKRSDGKPYDFMRDAGVPILNAAVPTKLLQTPVAVDCAPRFQSMVVGAAQTLAVALQPVYLNAAQLAFVDWSAVWLELERYKRVRGFTHLIIDQACLPKLFEGEHHGWYVLLMPAAQLTMSWENVAIWKRVVMELLKKYVEAFYNHHEKAFFEPRLELVSLSGEHPNLREDQYHLSWEAKTDQDQVLHDVEQLENEIAQARAGIVPANQSANLRAAVTSMQLLKPLLYVNDNRITVTPVPLNDSEFNFVRDLNAYLESKPDLLKGAEVYLLRNKALGGGIGFFEAGAFYPDFILWVLRDSKQFVAFVEPHGLRNESPHKPKMQFYATIKEIEQRVNQDRTQKIILNSFIVSPTLMNNLAWGDGWKTLDDFAQQHVLMMKNEPDSYIPRLFNLLLN